MHVCICVACICIITGPSSRSGTVCPFGDPWGTSLPLETRQSWAPLKTPEGTNTKVTSAKGHFCAYPTKNPDAKTTAFKERHACRNTSPKLKDNEPRVVRANTGKAETV